MAKVVTAYGNFAKGQVDHDMMGRFDLPIYTSSMDVFQNFISNFKGNAIFSAGFISRVAFQDCAFIEFKFGITQNYLCTFYANKIRFLAFDTNGVFGWVESEPNVLLEVSTPYTLAHAKEISLKGQYTQNNDVMIVTHRLYEPRKLTRTAANAFTFSTFKRTNDPFTNPSNSVNDTSASSVLIGTGSKTFTVSAAKAYVVGQTITINVTSDTSYYMKGTVTSYSGTTLVVNVEDTGQAGTFGSWTITQVANGWPGCCLFYKGRLYYASTSTKTTDVWFSNSGLYDDFTITNPLTDSSAFNFTLADITQQIDWLFAGDNSLIAGSADGILAINGGGVNTAITAATVQANITSAEPTNGVYPVKKQGLVFYVGFTGRNVYYFKYDILTEAFLSQDSNLVAYDITKGGLGKLRYKKDKYDLIFSVRGDSKLTSLVLQEAEKINGWHYRTTAGDFRDIAVMTDNKGLPKLFGLTLRNGVYYIEQQAEYVEFSKRTDFWTPDETIQEQWRDMDDEAYARKVSDQLLDCVYLDNALTLTDYRTSTITFTPTGTDPNTGKATGTLSCGIAGTFAGTDVGKHIVYKTLTGYESGRYLITSYSNDVLVNVTVLQEPKTKFDAPLYVWTSWYKSFSTVSGLSQYNGQTVGVVTDGAFLDKITISGDTQTFDKQIISIVFGYMYTGLIKSLPLGFQFQGYNTQVTLKEISRCSVRCVNTLGLKIGSSIYSLEEVQLRTKQDINYLPPRPIDGTQDVDLTDDSEQDKSFYIVQDVPQPACIANFFVEANYAVST